jgi:Phage integrase, N-terminal SAM-like domain
MTSSLLPEAANPAYDLGGSPSEDQLAAVAFLARYGGRTLEAYRHDLRYFFLWAADHGVEVLAATRAHIEIYRAALEQRGLAASTIDRRLSTVCGYFRFATSTVAFRPTPPSTYDDRRSSRPKATAWTAVSSAGSCSPPSTTTAITPRWPCCLA